MKIRRFTSMLLSAVVLLSFGLNVEAKEMEESAVYEISAADFEEIESVDMEKEDLGFIPVEDLNTSVEETIAEEEINTRQAGDPFERMEFYYMYAYPIVRDVSTKEEGVLTGYVRGVQSQTATYLFGAYNVEETQKMYREIVANGFDILGWQIKVNFRFDFYRPLTWKLSIDGGEETTANVPEPHNPYQRYTYTYNSFFRTDPLKYYNTSFKGSVRYYGKSTHKYADENFSAMLAFNTPN